MNTRHFHNMSSLRIYLQRGGNHRGTTWLGRLFRKSLSRHILDAALESGVTHASLHSGTMGFTKDATAVPYDSAEAVPRSLPICIELVAPRRILEQFVGSQRENLRNATLLMVDGAGFSPEGFGAHGTVGRAAGTGKVEYLAGEAASILRE